MIPILCAVFLCCLIVTASPIEVHENVNESPVEMGAILNVSSTAVTNDSMTAERSFHNATSEQQTMLPPHGSRHPSTTTPQQLLSSVPTPKNHKLPIAFASIHGHTLSSPEVAVTTASSAFTIPSSQVDTGKDVPQEEVDNHHITTGYRKRQLHTNAMLYVPTNDTNGRSFDKQTAKMFMPSPQLTDFYVAEDALIPSPKYRGAAVPQHVDASYPASLTDSGSNWFGVDRVPEQQPMERLHPYNSSHWYYHKNGNVMWLSQGQPQATVSPPEYDTINVYKHPKGKWKWVADEEETTTSSVRKPSDRPPIEFQDKHVNHHHLYSGPFSGLRNHPYSFDGVAAKLPTSATSISSDNRDVTSSLAGEILTANESPKDGGKGHDFNRVSSPWKHVVQMLSAAIPIGILISALTPQVVHVNPNATLAAFQMPTPSAASNLGFNRQRLLEPLDPAHAQILTAANDFLTSADRSPAVSHKNTDCDRKKFCQLTVIGKGQQANVLNQILWKNANETPSERARLSGLQEIFEAAKHNDCQRFKCELSV